MQQAVGAVSDRLQRPQSHLARTRRAQKIGLAGRPGELFDDHQPSVESAHQRQDCASRIARRFHERRVVALGVQVETTAECVVVDVLECAVVSEEIAASLAAQDCDLLAHVVGDRRGDEPLEVQHERRIVISRRAERQIDLVPVGIELAPEPCAPSCVQRIESPVLFAQPLPERETAAVAEALAVLVVEFVVDLPPDDVWIVAVMLRERFHDPPREASIHRAVVAVLSPRLIVGALA